MQLHTPLAYLLFSTEVEISCLNHAHLWFSENKVKIGGPEYAHIVPCLAYLLFSTKPKIGCLNYGCFLPYLAYLWS